ncbi:MAG: molecular chaperone DnaJ [Eubacteriales bacterium]|nr:molecular chaperone DnaJ [Eubacteriales bacterium]
MKYFKNVKSYEDMKEQYKKLLKENHPDNGGDVEVMKAINVEYDSIFKIWKDRHNAEVEPAQQTTETADSTRTQFYTECGWEGHNHDWNRSLKEVAVIVRNYVKEKYPTFKFSVRTSYASMCQELHVSLKEAPFDIYKTVEDLTREEIDNIMSKASYNHYTKLDCWSQDEAKTEISKIWNEGNHFMMVYRDDIAAMLQDVDSFVNSYNYEDCDGMIDYFDVDFYYFDCKPAGDFKIVPKTARIKNKESKPATKKDATKAATAPAIEDTTAPLEYKITQGEDTRDGSILWLVRIEKTLSKDEYIKENNKMRELGGYYSKFRHAFIFRQDPSEKLTGKAA